MKKCLFYKFFKKFWQIKKLHYKGGAVLKVRYPVCSLYDGPKNVFFPDEHHQILRQLCLHPIKKHLFFYNLLLRGIRTFFSSSATLGRNPPRDFKDKFLIDENVLSFSLPSHLLLLEDSSVFQLPKTSFTGEKFP